MSDNINKERYLQVEEIEAKYTDGMMILILNSILIIVGIFSFIYGISLLDRGLMFGLIFLLGGILYSFIIGPIMYIGLKTLKPNEALVLTLFGKYVGTLKGEGFFFVNPFVSAVNPASKSTTSGKVGI